MTHSNRRDFLKTSATAAAGAAVVGSLANGAYAAPDGTMKVGLVGCGGRGSKAAVQALRTEGPVELVAMADAFLDQGQGSLKRIKNTLGKKKDRVKVTNETLFTGFDAYKKVLAQDIDLVILATPPGFRPIHFEAAIAAGKHVFMEKPVATDPAGVNKVLAAAKEAKKKNLKVGVGLQRHHQNKYLAALKKVQEEKAIGDIIACRAYWNGGGVWDPRKSRAQVKSEMEYQMRNWYYYNWLCGDHIVEQHIHNIDVCNWFKGKVPVKAQGMGGREVRTHPKYGEIFDHHYVEFTYDDNTKMFSHCRHIRGCWNSVSEHLHGTKGTLDLVGRGAFIKGNERWAYRGAGNDPYQTEHDDLFSAIRNNKPYNEAEYGASSTMTAILGRMATYGGKEITYDAALKSNRSLMPANFSFDADPPTKPNEKGEYPIPIPGFTKVL